MSEEHYKFVLDILEKAPFPTSTEITDEARVIFEAACDVELMYRGHPDTLMQSLRIFFQTDVLPYAYAGAAKIIAAAAYISGGKSDSKGLKIAMQWLDKARAIVPDRFEINIIAFNLYDGADRNAKRRTLLDGFKAADPTIENNYRYAIAEMRYWDKMNNLVLVKDWNEKAFKAAQNDIQRLYALNSLAGIYLSKKPKEALALYQEVVKIDSRDAWAWHNMSIICMDAGDYTRAGSYNDQALNLMEFGNALDVREKLIKLWSSKRHADILADVPPYNTVEVSRPQNQVVGVFKKLFGG